MGGLRVMDGEALTLALVEGGGEHEGEKLELALARGEAEERPETLPLPLGEAPAVWLTISDEDHRGVAVGSKGVALPREVPVCKPDPRADADVERETDGEREVEGESLPEREVEGDGENVESLNDGSAVMLLTAEAEMPRLPEPLLL